MHRMRIRLAALMKFNYISWSCLFVQSKFPVSSWLEIETQCCLQLRSAVFYVHMENVTGAVVKCILQPTEDKTVTGKLRCLWLRWWCVLSLKITHLITTIILFYFFQSHPNFPPKGSCCVTQATLCHSLKVRTVSWSQSVVCISALRSEWNRQLLLNEV